MPAWYQICDNALSKPLVTQFSTEYITGAQLNYMTYYALGLIYIL